MRTMKNTLKDEHVGSTAVETTLQLPLIFGTFMMLLYFLFMVLAYIAYGNIANNIAHELNMRQTGFNQAVSLYYNSTTGGYDFPQVYSRRVSESANSRVAYTQAGNFLLPNQVVCYPDTKWLRSGVYYALDVTGQNRVGDQFALPFVQVDEIKVTTSKPLDFSYGTGTRVAANTLVHVEITFKTFNPFGVFNLFGDGSTGVYSSLFRIKTHGYGVIA